MRSARAVVARAPPEILDPRDSEANAKAMRKWCVFISFSSHTLPLKKDTTFFMCETDCSLKWYQFYICIGQFQKVFPFKLQKEVVATKDCCRSIMSMGNTFFVYLQQIVLETSSYWIIPM